MWLVTCAKVSCIHLITSSWGNLPCLDLSWNSFCLLDVPPFILHFLIGAGVFNWQVIQPYNTQAILSTGDGGHDRTVKDLSLGFISEHGARRKNQHNFYNSPWASPKLFHELLRIVLALSCPSPWITGRKEKMGRLVVKHYCYILSNGNSQLSLYMWRSWSMGKLCDRPSTHS